MAQIRRQRTNKRTTEKVITGRAPVDIRSSSHSPETGELLDLTFKLADISSPELGAADTFYVVTLDRNDVQDLWTYLIDAEARLARLALARREARS